MYITGAAEGRPSDRADGPLDFCAVAGGTAVCREKTAARAWVLDLAAVAAFYAARIFRRVSLVKGSFQAGSFSRETPVHKAGAQNSAGRSTVFRVAAGGPGVCRVKAAARDVSTRSGGRGGVLCRAYLTR